MRNKVVHGYTQIDKELFIAAISEDIPFFKEYIESVVIEEVLCDPYCLYEEEYAEVVARNESQRADKEDLCR